MGNGSLMITIAYLLQNSIKWRNAIVRIKMVVHEEEEEEEEAVTLARQNLLEIIQDIRIEAEPKII